MALGIGTWAGDLFSERWNGSTWKVVPTAKGASSADELYSISCTSSSDCVAVGAQQGANGNLIEHWNGTTWSVMSSVGVRNSDGLLTVSCSRPTACLATGSNYSGATFTERWDGDRWSLVPDPALPGPPAYLGSVWCVGPSSCLAVGDLYRAKKGSSGSTSDATASTTSATGIWSTLSQRWNGATWSPVPSRGVAGAQNQLNAVACGAQAACSAVGDYSFGANAGNSHALAERWNGSSWTITPVPDASHSLQNTLEAISCGGSSDCVAVGSYVPAPAPGEESGTSTLIEHWDRNSWTTMSSTGPASDLHAISCVGARWCIAVGDGGAPGTKTVVERWNGGAWAIIPSPSPSYPGPA
jgi:hypothetical protein